MQHDLVDRYPTHGESYSAGNALSLRQHEEYLSALKPLLEQWRNEGSVIVVGDDNRRIPYAWGPKRTYDLLESALDGYGVATSGMLSGVNEKSIDHVAETLNILTPEREARGHGVTMTAIIETALQRYFDTEEIEPLDSRVIRRLDRIELRIATSSEMSRSGLRRCSIISSTG
ncbi:MAG: hypothetical protein RJS97_00675 [Parvibaculaceae bacterium]